MSKQDYTSEHGPGWVDVDKAIDHLESTFSVKVTLLVERHRMKGNEWRTLVKCECRAADEWPHGRIRVAKQFWWDRREYRTITAVWFNALMSCDSYLSQSGEDALKQAAF